MQAAAESAPLAAWAARRQEIRDSFGRWAEGVVIPIGALLLAGLIFAIFLLVVGKSPVQFYQLMYKGGFGTWFSIQNTLERASPVLLTGLCVALPAQIGLVIIGGEGAVVLGGLAAAVIAQPLQPLSPFVVIPAMAVAGIAMGGIWIGLAGALRHYRGVNETISSLLLTYIAIAIMNQLVEGPLRDPASLNKPSTYAVGQANMIGTIPGMEVHWGLVVGIVLCILLWALIYRTSFGFAARMTGGNVRAARLQGLPVGRLIVTTCAIAGGCAGLAGMLQVASVLSRANGSLAVGYGYTGILIAFLARHNPLAIIPVAILMGGIDAAGGLVQRRMGLPDATVLVLQGVIFVVILLSDTAYGRLRLFSGGSAK